MITLKTTLGDIVIELDYDKAPKTAKNFEEYVKSGFYKGTIFHRVIKGFMVQGGGLTADLSQKETLDPIENEADNGLKNDRGTIAMARTQDPHSATAQFFINTVNNSFLNFRSKDINGWGYCVFGKVVKGMDVVDAIEKSKTTTVAYYQDVPVETIEILDAQVEA
ncbi:MAG: peptidylprolyl isomerase [Succinatimonas sp.]|jgi:peptidyl-prolyl cis-trans isomerase B (cyclophilin B)|nr:peptidylprolyl isomerase [Succinatimonas sp.]MDD5869271.1 peptidylprolyl isomerase [Succinatimonas sp.]MDY5721834.1 peptidylprolyl isomerase [Succinivibrio sp.]